MKLPVTILIIHTISILLVSLPFAFYWIVRNKKGIITSFISSGIICIVGMVGLISKIYNIEKIHFIFMFGPILYFSIYQFLRFLYKKETGKEPVSSYLSSFDFTDGRGLFAGDYILNFYY